MAWLRSQLNDADIEEYMTWWACEIVPAYHDAGISSVAVATGNPYAPGELSDLPPKVGFKMGYFADLETLLGWQPQ